MLKPAAQKSGIKVRKNVLFFKLVQRVIYYIESHSLKQSCWQYQTRKIFTSSKNT